MQLNAYLAIENCSRAVVIAWRGELADSLWTRFRGLMLRQSLDADQALIIDPCSSIHMFFMRFPLDVLYVDRHDRIVRVQENIQPWRIGPLRTKGARYVVELPVGTIARTGTTIGDTIRIRHLPG
jgi:uncharacterized membrane protein (UPF0127 family)